MVKTKVDVNDKELPCSLYLDGYEKTNLDALNKRVKKNWDFLGIVVGGEGNGKTVYVLQRALYMSADFGIVAIVFNEKQFLEATENLPKGSSIVWDESDAASDHWASTMLKAIIKRLKRVRKNNYKIFLVTPTFFDFGKYFVLHRASFLIDVYAEGLERGYFRFFGKKKMKELYLKGKKEWNMKAVMPNFRGRFTNLPEGFPINMSDNQEYDMKKDAAMKQLEEETLDPKKAVIQYRRTVIQGVQAVLEEKGTAFSHRELARALDVSKTTITSDIKAIKEGEI